MKCNIEWLSAYLDGALADDKRAKLEEHLKTCEVCTAKLEEFARVEQAAKKIPAPQLSEAYWENFANRVQNKLTIREKQRTSPAWLEALKGLFQPTTGKLAVAGSLATILLVAIIGQDYWKKEAYQPPKFEAVAPPVNDKIDSVQEPAKDESAFRTAEKDNKAGLVEDKRLDQPARERGTATLSQRPAENRPAASAPLGRALAAPEGQESNVAPSLAASAERDDAVSGDTVVTAGKKAQIRKEVASSQVKVSAEEIEKLWTQRGTSAPHLGIRASVPSDTVKMKEDTVLKSKPLATDIQEYSLIKGGFDAQYSRDSAQTDIPLATQPSIDANKNAGQSQMRVSTKGIIEFSIIKGEMMLSDSLDKDSLEYLYILLSKQYLHFYRLSSESKDWKIANKRIKDFLKKELSDYTRQHLLQIQAELKKLKK